MIDITIVKILDHFFSLNVPYELMKYDKAIITKIIKKTISIRGILKFL